MADIRPFRGYRYDLGRTGALSDLVAPPYDVIDAGLQQRLYDQSPYNAIRVELNKDEPGDGPTNNKYSRAASTLSEWQNSGALCRDSYRNLYVVEQEFSVEGKTYRRRGFIARVRLEPFGQGRIYPHEQTMSGPKADRLNLFRATGMNLSPVFGLYPDPLNDVFDRLEPVLRNNLPLEAKDHLGVTSRLWPITDDRIVGSVISGMADKPIFIADGHHRYETGLKYRDEAEQAGRLTGDDDPANFVMMMLVSMADPGLIILPTHRLVSGFPGLTAEGLKKALEPRFRLEQAKSSADAWETIELDGGQGILGFYTKADGRWQVGRLIDSAVMDQSAPNQSADWRSLGVSILHVAVLDRLIPALHGGQASCKYVHLVREVDEAIGAGSCDLAVLVPPAGMDHVERIAGNLEKMPAKSTYFYPKLLTGLVYNSLKSS